jgi:LmbE family N-acetylglucosaminyl deacetylase
VSARHIFLSPHLDDAVFSCAGTIATLVAAGDRVVVVTVTAGSTGTKRLPESARSLHETWGLSGDVVARRREEDRVAASILGFEPVHLDFLDAIYRTNARGRFLYPTRDSLFPSGRWRNERALVHALAGRIDGIVRRHVGSILYAPLALGNHVDHQLVRQAVRAAGLAPVWYEDFPYLGSEPSLASGDAWAAIRHVARLVGSRSAGLIPVVVPFDPVLRVRAMAAYRSQLGSVFGSREEMGDDVRKLFPRTAGGQPAERLWHVSAPQGR